MKKDTRNLILVGLVIGVLWYTGALTSIINQFTTPGSTIPGGSTNTQQVANTLDFFLADAYAGSGMSSKTVAVYRNGILQETCTTASDGTIETALRYIQGETLDLFIDCGSNEVWDRIVVPTHPANLIEASDPTPVNLKGATHPTLTDLFYIAATSTSDDGTWNQTAASGTAMFTYGWTVGTDDTGLVASDYDPIYNTNPGVVLYIEVSAGDYSTVSLTGYDGFKQMGSKYVWWFNIDPRECSKDKIGVNYDAIADGSFTKAFSVSAGSLATNSTVQITAYEHDNAMYYLDHGSHLPSATSLCETTLTIYA